MIEKRIWTVALGISAVLGFPGLVVGQEKATPDWENPAVFSINKEPAHATLTPFRDAETALGGRDSTSSRVQTLNGTWKFWWVRSPAERPTGFHEDDFDVADWHDLQVPSCWEFEGFGYPVYLDESYPFPANPPRIPHDYNPVGSFRREFSLPEDWTGMEVFLQFGAVRSAMYVWVNGHEVGYSQGSRTPAEFRITEYLRPGENTLAVEVYRWSDGSYLESQDFWRVSGIQRDVELIARPATYLRDFWFKGDLDDAFRDGLMSLSVDVGSHRGEDLSSLAVRADLLDSAGRSALGSPVDLPVRVSGSDAGRAELEAVIESPAKWTAETPSLYTLVLSLVDEDGTTLEAVTSPVGFRRVDIADGQLRVNGRAITIRGVNRHEHDPHTGQVVSEETMLEDIRLMQRFNINAVRTSHYPNESALVRAV